MNLIAGYSVMLYIAHVVICWSSFYFLHSIHGFWYVPNQVNARYTMRLKKRLQFEEKKSANQRRVGYCTFMQWYLPCMHFLGVFFYQVFRFSCWSQSLLSLASAHFISGTAPLWCRDSEVAKLCCWEDVASLHGKGCIPAVPFAHIPLVHKQV